MDDATSAPITNIVSMARAWTGFDLQQFRGNIESRYSVSTRNKLDPMQIKPEWRDSFPKPDLLGGFFGDGYPL